MLTSFLTLKGPGGGICPPRHFLLYLSRLLFFRAETSRLFSFKTFARFKTIFTQIGPRVMTRRCVIERWVQWKTDQKLIFNGNYTQIVFFVFRIHFHYVLSYLFGVFGVRTCVSIHWHTSLPKNATFAWKNSEKPWFWRFLVIFVFLTWRHCGVIQGMFVLFWYQWTRSGHSYPLVPHTWCFVNRFPRSWGAESAPPPPPGCEMGPKSPALFGLRGYSTPEPYFWRLCIFSENKATLDKVSYGSGQKCSKELKNHSFTSVEDTVWS